MDLFSPSSSPPQQEMCPWDFSPELLDFIGASSDVLSPLSEYSGILSPLSEQPSAVPRSAFVSYTRPEFHDSSDFLSSQANKKKNIHLRMIDLLRRIPRDRLEARTGEYSPGFRHMMRERQRRERLSQSYADLHSMLPYRSKGDKNSIVQSAALYVKELKGVKEELLKRNEELRIKSVENSSLGGEKIKIRLDPASTLDSMIGALQCLKSMDAKARAIQTEFSGNELMAIINIESKVGSNELERALMETCR
ncbi:uncharacterized protein A4U43_UnF9780 [Asparagus officinalis]|uniref:BHLH domain-containing protein n=1 Tax=Asparagus officinalis TaxID=4686 RepID=A0A1R3L5L2_ASPOF|nr:transcription factor BHLH148-like [Asparagus officinalis]ONK54911.1 uncharacterized protein A4U43_UnF9780 [Asparagus officinalis]